MAPEMTSGDDFDGRADLYALGCVGYYLLTGRLVFEATNALQMLTKHLQQLPEPPSRHTTQPIPGALDRVILACLAKEPAYRPASAAELSRSLAAIETEPWGEEEAARWWGVHFPVKAGP
jgi:serine/threonine-protein kinase